MTILETLAHYFHLRHSWMETERAVVQGIEISGEGFEYQGPAGMVKKLMDARIAAVNDRTSIVLRCSQCGDLKEVILMGNHMGPGSIHG